MTGLPKSERQRRLNMTAKLLKRSTWKCGRIERLIIRHLQHVAEKTGRAASKVASMVRHHNLKGKDISEFIYALERLEKRYIVRLEPQRVEE